MSIMDYKKIMEETSFGCAYCRLILDEKGEPVDYVFIDVNIAFENMTGIKRETVVGSRISELSPEMDNETSERISLYGSVVLNNEKRVLEQYSEHLKRWYRIEAFPMGDLSLVIFFFDITELKESRDRFEQYMKYAPDGICVADGEGGIISVNPAGCMILGYSEEELRNFSIIDFLLPENRENGIEGIKNLVATGSDRREMPLERKDGGIVWVSLKTVNLPDGTFMGFFRDISDRKKAEIELKEFAMFNKTLLETIPIPVYYKGLDGRYLGSNRAMDEFYGKTTMDLAGKTVYDISPPELAENYRKMDDDLLTNPGVQVYEEQWTDSDGELHDVIFHKATFNNIDGDVGGIIGALVDITGLKKTHRELELYFRAIQAVDQPVLITDSRGNIIRVNNAFIKMYGFTFDELKGINPKILNPGRDVYINFGYTNEEYEELFRSMWNTITDPDTGTWENVLINRKKDGTIIWVKLLINAVYNDEHIPVNYIVLPVDITSTVQKEAMTRIELYRTIAALAELRDNETGNHMRRVGIFAKLLARGYNMPEKYCNDIEIFAPLHDIGKVGILDSLLLAERALTPDEFAVMKSHTILGHNIVKGKKELEMVAAITIAHHERYDGSGYPKGLKGEGIPLSARITAVADVYDALRSRRPYKSEWSHEAARDYILGNKGAHFDPVLVRIFNEMSDRFDTIYNELKD